MIRRHFLLLVTATALAAGTPGLASNADGSLPGFEDPLKAGGPVMIHVTAPWCGECKKPKPIVAKLLATPQFPR